MHWLTIAYSMTAAACVTLAAVHLLVWFRQPAGRAHLAFAMTAIFVAAIAPLELLMVRAQTIGQFGTAIRWMHLPASLLTFSLVWFLWLDFRTGRLWLACAACGLRALALILNFSFTPNLNYREITGLKQVALFGGESVSASVGVVNPWSLIGQLSTLFLFLYMLDASVTLWRRGDFSERRRAVVVGGSMVFFILTLGSNIVLILAGFIVSPFFLSFPFMAIVAAMGYELSLDVIKAGQLSLEVKTERRQAEEAKNNLAAIVESSIDAILSKTLDGTIISWNAGAEKMYGYSPSEMIGQRVSILAPTDVNGEVPEILERIRRGESMDHLETVRVTRDGRRVDVSLTISPIKDEHGTIIGASTIARDITRRKRDQEVLQQLSGRLLALQDEEHQRIAAELHDGLGQSLAIIKNRALMGLRDQTNQNKVMEQLEEIAATATSSILEVRGIAHNLRPYELDRLGLVAAIESMIERISDSTPLSLFADMDRIEGLLSPEAETSVYRIIQEGLNNVVKHSNAAAGRIEIKKSVKHLTISVQDNGIGISRSAPTDNGNNVGGFGLAGIAERVRLLGGSFAIDSQPTRGTTLTVRLELPSVAAE